VRPLNHQPFLFAVERGLTKCLNISTFPFAPPFGLRFVVCGSHTDGEQRRTKSAGWQSGYDTWSWNTGTGSFQSGNGRQLVAACGLNGQKDEPRRATQYYLSMSRAQFILRHEQLLHKCVRVWYRKTEWPQKVGWCPEEPGGGRLLYMHTVVRLLSYPEPWISWWPRGSAGVERWAMGNPL